MNNAPQVKIQYLVNYDLEISGQDGVSGLDTSDLNPLSDLSNINNQDAKLRGKKGFILSGGSVDDATGEVSGVLLDGTYTLFSDAEKSYNGIMGDCLSGNDYKFEKPQYITIRAKNENTYIRSLLIYFDPETYFVNGKGEYVSEFATKISFSGAKKYEPVSDNNVDVPEFNVATDNDSPVFLYNFGSQSTLTEIKINIDEWNKKNSLVKILKIVTGYTGVYDKTNLLKFDFNLSKIVDEEQIRFGVSNNECSVHVLDKDLMIGTLYKKDLIYDNIQINITVDGITQGVFYLDNKNSEKGSNEWVFNCVDRLNSLKNVKMPMFAIKSRTVYQLVMELMSGVVSNIIWENDAFNYCNSVSIEKSYFEANQTLYDLLIKCCQVGLLRIYIDAQDVCRITSGVN